MTEVCSLWTRACLVLYLFDSFNSLTRLFKTLVIPCELLLNNLSSPYPISLSVTKYLVISLC